MRVVVVVVVVVARARRRNSCTLDVENDDVGGVGLDMMAEVMYQDRTIEEEGGKRECRVHELRAVCPLKSRDPPPRLALRARITSQLGLRDERHFPRRITRISSWVDEPG